MTFIEAMRTVAEMARIIRAIKINIKPYYVFITDGGIFYVIKRTGRIIVK